MIIEGHYQNANMYIQNPHTGKDSGFCVIKCLVNNKEVDSINSSAFEIPLMSMGFKEGDSLKIEIWHHVDCKPKVIYNPPAPKKPVDFYDFKVDSNQVLTFKTKGEVFKYNYTIEAYKWNKWVKIGEVESTGTYQENMYSVKLPLHSGKNKIRIKVMKTPSTYIFSEPYEFWSKIKPVMNYTNTIVYLIEFTGDTGYELYDAKGNVVKKGYGKVIMCTDLKNGTYYLNYDNKSCEIKKVNLEDIPK